MWGVQARVYVAVLLMFVVTLGLLYVVLFVSGDSQPSVWAVMLLRVLAFLLPLYLIVQARAPWTAFCIHCGPCSILVFSKMFSSHGCARAGNRLCWRTSASAVLATPGACRPRAVMLCSCVLQKAAFSCLVRQGRAAVCLPGRWLCRFGRCSICISLPCFLIGCGM